MKACGLSFLFRYRRSNGLDQFRKGIWLHVPQKGKPDILGFEAGDFL
jgi:hypothetical protein